MTLINKIPFWKSPMWFKLLLAKMLVRCMTLQNAPNEIVLYNELRLYIETNGRPTTSNPNYWINKDKTLKSEEDQAADRAMGIYPMANEDDYPDFPDVNRLNSACRSAFMNGFRYAQQFKVGTEHQHEKETNPRRSA